MSDNDDFAPDPDWIVLADGAGLIASVQPEAVELATMLAGIPGPGPANPENTPVESPAQRPEQAPDESPEEHPDSVPPDDPQTPGEGPTLEP